MGGIDSLLEIMGKPCTVVTASAELTEEDVVQRAPAGWLDLIPPLQELSLMQHYISIHSIVLMILGRLR